MRRLFAVTLIVALVGCGSDLLGPVQTMDGNWTGTQNGIAMGMALTQSGDSVSGTVTLAGIGGGEVQGTVGGTFDPPQVALVILVPGYDPLAYTGTMSTTQAKVFGAISGSGYSNLEVDIHKQ
jgi:hypothetical protein